MKFAKKLVSLLLSVLLIASVFAVVPVSFGAEPVEETINVFFRDQENWDANSEIYVYAWNSDNQPICGDWNNCLGMTYLFDDEDHYSNYVATIPATAAGIIFKVSNHQTADITTNIADGAWWNKDALISNTFVAATDSTCSVAGNVAYYNLIDKLYDTDLNELADPRKLLAAHTWDTENPVWGELEVDPDYGFGYVADLTFTCSECGATTTVTGESGMVVEEEGTCVDPEYSWTTVFVDNFEGNDYSQDYIISEEPVDPTNHPWDLQHFEAVSATATTPGNVEYWYCDTCEKCFADAAGTEEIADVVIPATGVATINGTPYTSLAAAVAAAEDGDTIKVIADCDAAYISVKGKAITINVASKVTVTGTQMSGFDVPMFKVASTGSLTLTGSGSLVNENDAIVNNNGFVKAGGPTLNGNICAIYNGGTAQVTSGKLIGIQGSIINASQTATATISGGQIYGELTLADPDATFVVSGGIFDAQVDEDFLSEDIAFELARTDGRYSYAKMSNSILNTGDGVLKMLKDTSVTTRMPYGTFSNDVTLDLNGHTLSSTASDQTILMGRTGKADSPRILNIVDNSVDGGGKIMGATDNSKSTSALISISGAYNYVTIGEDVYLEGGVIALLGDHQTLDVYGNVNGLDDFAVATNGADTTNATINIHDGAWLHSDDVAVYLPGGAVTTIGDATIIGSTAVYIKSGTTTITGGEFYGVGDAAGYAYNGSGANATGDALVVDSCGYPGGMPAVTITGGTFDSINAAPVASYQYGNNAKLLSFLSGGAYSDIVPEELIAAGYFCAVTKDVDGYYNIVSNDCPGHRFAPIGDVVACTICGKGYTGLVRVNGAIYYYEDGFVCKDKGLIEINNYFYYVLYDGRVKVDGDRTVTEEKANGLLPAGTYHFGADGKMEIKDGVIDEDGYYWEASMIAKGKGLICIDGDYYYVTYTGKIKKDADRSVEPDKLNGYPIEPGVYHFGPDGKMVLPENGVGEDGFYRENGRIVKDVGIVEQGGYLYYVLYNGKVKMNGARTVSEEKANDLVPAGTYHFDEDGKMTDRPEPQPANGIGTDGFYRENGEVQYDKGIVEIEGYYYYVTYTGKIKVDADRTVTEEYANDLVPAGTYHFGEDGKMTNPPVEEPANGIGTDGLYRENGVVQYDKGIVEIEGYLYYVLYNGKVKKDNARTVTEDKANGFVPAGLYHFDAEGKMIDRPEIVDQPDGVGSDLYYRVNGEIVKDAGIIKIGNDYYYVLPSGKVYVNGDRAVTAEKANDLVPAGTYHFDAAGKMTNPPEFEIL